MRSVSKKALLGDSVKIGYYTIVEDDVVIGDNVMIGNNVTIYKGTKIGKDCRIDDNAVIGKQPMKAVTSVTSDDKKQPPCEIGNGCIIGTSVVIYAGCRIGDNCLVADLSTVRENVSIENKTIIGRGVAIENHCKVGSNCKLETNVYLTAYSIVEDYVFMAPGVITSNDNFAGRSKERYKHFKGITVKKGGRIGAGATILPGRIIYEDGFAAAGSVVTRDVKSEKIVVGNPAKVMKDIPEDQLLKNNS